MAREGLTGKTIAVGIGVTERTFRNKLTGKTEFTRSEILGIRNKFFPGHTIGYLFEMQESAKNA